MIMMYDLFESAIASREQRYRVPLDGPADALPTGLVQLCEWSPMFTVPNP